MQDSTSPSFLTKYATVFFILYSIYYIPIEGRIALGPIKLTLLALSILVLLIYTLKISKAFIIGSAYIIYQFLSASFHPESWRWSTLLFSFGLVCTYVCFYNLVTIERVFTIERFIKICKWIMMAYFVVCIIQQLSLLAGINYFPLINLCQIFNRGIGCNSLCQEPSTFGRFMLVFYYAYIKCCEYKRDEGPFTLKELFSGEHKWVTIRFLWMMTTMGSGTAFFCIILLSSYFVRRNNWFYVVPFLIGMYSLLQISGMESWDRATNAIEAASTMDTQNVRQTDTSAAVRINPILNSINADFSKFETWFGKGIDSGLKDKANRTLFDDYGFIFYLLSLILGISCSYGFSFLAILFLFTGVAGGAGSNIQYAWTLMMVFTCVKYFHENRYNPEIYEEEEEHPQAAMK